MGLDRGQRRAANRSTSVSPPRLLAERLDACRGRRPSIHVGRSNHRFASAPQRLAVLASICDGTVSPCFATAPSSALALRGRRPCAGRTRARPGRACCSTWRPCTSMSRRLRPSRRTRRRCRRRDRTRCAARANARVYDACRSSAAGASSTQEPAFRSRRKPRHAGARVSQTHLRTANGLGFASRPPGTHEPAKTRPVPRRSAAAARERARARSRGAARRGARAGAGARRGAPAAAPDLDRVGARRARARRPRPAWRVLSRAARGDARDGRVARRRRAARAALGLGLPRRRTARSP